MTLAEGIVKINSKVLEPADLKKCDKFEKDIISTNGFVRKGKP